MKLLGILEISGTALQAQRQRAEVLASNLATAETTRTAEGGPYRRQHVLFGARRPSLFARQLSSFGSMHSRGVRVTRVVEDSAPPVRRFEPAHPDADEEGYVAFPAINPIEEMVNLMASSRAYQLNLSAVQATKAMIQQSLQLIR